MPTIEKIKAALIHAGIKHPHVWKGISQTDDRYGYWMREFSAGEDTFLGKSYSEFIEGEPI